MRGTIAKRLRRFVGMPATKSEPTYVNRERVKEVAVPVEVDKSGRMFVLRLTRLVIGNEPRAKYNMAKKHYRVDPKFFQSRIFPVIA